MGPPDSWGTAPERLLLLLQEIDHLLEPFTFKVYYLHTLQPQTMLYPLILLHHLLQIHVYARTIFLPR